MGTDSSPSPLRAKNEYVRARAALQREIDRLTAITDNNLDRSRAGTPFNHQTLVERSKTAIKALEAYRPDAISAADAYVFQRDAAVEMLESPDYKTAEEHARTAIAFLRKFDWKGTTVDRLLLRLNRFLDIEQPDAHRLLVTAPSLRNLVLVEHGKWTLRGNGFVLWSPPLHSSLKGWYEELTKVSDVVEGYDAADNLQTLIHWIDASDLGEPGYTDAWVRTVERGVNWLDDWIEEHPLGKKSSPDDPPLVQVEIDVLMALREAYPQAQLIQDVAERAGYAKNRKLVSKTLAGLAERKTPLVVRKSSRKGYGLTEEGVTMVDSLG